MEGGDRPAAQGGTHRPSGRQTRSRLPSQCLHANHMSCRANNAINQTPCSPVGSPPWTMKPLMFLRTHNNKKQHTPPSPARRAHL